MIWHGLNGDGQGWRRDPRLLRAYTWATLLWALVFVARVVVQGLLYRYDEETWLGIARLAMGYPLVGRRAARHDLGGPPGPAYAAARRLS